MHKLVDMPPFAPELSSWHRQTEADLPADRGEEEDRKRTRWSAQQRAAERWTASSSRGWLEGNAQSPARQGALVLGKDFVKSKSAKQPVP